MVRRWHWLLAFAACSATEGNVLIARDPPLVLMDSGMREPDANADAEPNQREHDAGAAAADTRGRCRIGGSKDGIYDSFAGDTLDATTWLVADGPVTFGGANARGGFARDNVLVSGGALLLRVRGDLYAGSVRANDVTGRPFASGKRSAAAVATRDLFASGTYQIQGRLVGPAPVEVAIWFVRDDDSQGAIDIATPGRNGAERSYGHVHMRSRNASASSETQFALAQSFDDAAAHILRFDWYTTAASSVSFWVDDEQRWQTTHNLPPKAAGRMWIVAWVPETEVADFDTAEIRIDNAFVTPFGNAGDVCVDGELSGQFLRSP
jgi:hypothetical protein